MGKVLSRPMVLLPLGVALLLAGLLTGLNSVGAWRWGSVIDDNRSWVEHEPLQKHGSAALALPVVLGFVLWVLPRFIW